MHGAWLTVRCGREITQASHRFDTLSILLPPGVDSCKRHALRLEPIENPFAPDVLPQRDYDFTKKPSVMV